MGIFDIFEKRSFHTNQPQLNELIREYSEMGFSKHYITKAWQQCKQNFRLFHDELIQISSEEDAKKMCQDDLFSSQYNLKKNLSKKEDEDIKRAIQISLQDERPESYEDLKDMIRKDLGKPVGLKNLGNTCYMNVMLQSIYNIKEFRNLILNVVINHPSNNDGILMILRLQEMFSVMVAGNRNYVNPLAFFEAMAKFKPSTQIHIFRDTMLVRGIQNDYYELWSTFLDTIEQGLKQMLIMEEPRERCSFEKVDCVVVPKQSSIIKQLNDIFYGRAEEGLSYQEGDNDLIRYSQTLFSVINLDSKDGELYKAFKNCQSLVIDEFMLEDGISKTEARIEIKILEPPKVLSFYVNRVNYDPKMKKVNKNNELFEFHERINLDCFYKNPEETIKYNTTIQDRLEHLSNDEIECQAQIMAFKEQDDSNAGQKFDQMIKLMEKTGDILEKSIQIDDFILQDQDSGMTSDMLSTANMIKQLEQYKKVYFTRRDILIQRLLHIQQEKKTLMEQKKNVYCLTSVIIHEGTAESGHYICFILDKPKQQWLKCNDRDTTYVTYDEVYKTATGKLGASKNVSGLVYEEQNWMQVSESQDALPQRLKYYVMSQDQSLLAQLSVQQANGRKY